MKNQTKSSRLLIPILIASFLIAGCGLSFGEQDKSVQETLTALTIQQTVLAREAAMATQDPVVEPVITTEFQNQDMEAEAIETQPVVVEPAQTEEIMEIVSETVPTENVDVSEPIQTEETAIDVNTLYENARILLYEDVHYDPAAVRYFRETLTNMGLSFTNVGSAKGRLKSELTAGAPDGNPWDLVIIASEHHGKSTPGEFFNYATDALDKGSSVILETWFLDKSYNGAAASLLRRCGVEFDKNWLRIPPEGMVLYPLESDHPVLNQPNSGLKFTDTTSYWAYDYDVGDLMKKSAGSDAVLLLGTKGTDKNAYGLVTICIDGRLTLQTFTSHNFTIFEYAPLLENYIYNALIARAKVSS
ncbi:MAG: hypothetical protein ACK2TU_00955 [Anaerolineales bacterium]